MVLICSVRGKSGSQTPRVRACLRPEGLGQNSVPLVTLYCCDKGEMKTRGVTLSCSPAVAGICFLLSVSCLDISAAHKKKIFAKFSYSIFDCVRVP